MDIIAHGLWGGVAVGRQKKTDYWLAVFFGLAPDLFSFGILTVLVWLGLAAQIDWSQGVPPMSAIPVYVHWLYNLTHSLVVVGVVIFVLYLSIKKIFLPLLAWPLHIIFDIFTHGLDFFPTPFLWPFSTPYFAGIAWSTPWVFMANWTLLLTVYIVWLVSHLNKKNEKSF